MSDLTGTSFYRTTPLDDLVGSPLIQNRSEALADQTIFKANTAGKNFEGVLNDYAKGLTNNSKTDDKTSAAYWPGCHPLTPIDCDADKALERSRENTQKEIESSISNILNAEKPGYRKVLPFKDANGNPIIDETPARLQRTNWQLDLAIDGEGKGFKLANGEFTRDGRFKFDDQGRPVTVNGGVPLQVCYKEGAPVDWSLKRLKIDFEGNVTDTQTGQELGKIESDKGKRSKVMQKYLEISNVNLPLEFMGLAQKLRLIDLTNGIFGTGQRLDSEAVGILGRLL